MTAPLDQEWAELSATWQHEPNPDVEQLRKQIGRQRRHLILMTTGEVLTTLAMLVGVGWVLARSPGPVPPGLLIAAGVHSAIVWVFTLWNRRGLWRPFGETTRQYLDLARLWRRRQAQVGGFVVGLVLIEFLVAAAWFLLGPSQTRNGWWLGGAWWLSVGVIGVALGWGIWYRRRALEHLGALDRLAERLHLASE